MPRKKTFAYFVQSVMFGSILLLTQHLCFAEQNERTRLADLPIAAQSSILAAMDAGAKYPVRVDPIVQLAELTASDGAANDGLGLTVAMSGNTIVVGAPFETINGVTNEGAVYVFVKPAGGWKNMTQVAKLTASDNPYEFGSSVAVGNNTIVVGAPQSNGNAGTVYVYTEPAGGWSNMTQTAEFSSPGGINDFFGDSVSVSGNVIVAGSLNGALGSFGAWAYVYVEPEGGWTDLKPIATLNDDTGAVGNGGVAISGNTIVVGYNGCCDDNGFTYNGQVDVYLKPAGGWINFISPTAVLTGTDETIEDFFGAAVALSATGKTVVAGSPYHQFKTGHDGAAYLFVEPTSGWTNMTQTARLSTNGTVQLGSSVATTDNAALVGDALTLNAYAFVMPKTGWKTTNYAAAEFENASTREQGLAVQQDTAVIGSPGTIVDGVVEGAAFVY